jgi:hypothetical protein
VLFVQREARRTAVMAVGLLRISLDDGCSTLLSARATLSLGRSEPRRAVFASLLS